MNRLSIACVSLMLSAAVLVGVLLTLALQSPGNEAQARLLSNTPKVVFMTAKISKSDEGLFMLDSNTGKMVIYGVSGNRSLELIGAQDFSKIAEVDERQGRDRRDRGR